MAEQSPMVRDFELSSRDSDSTDTRRTVTKRELTGSIARGNCLLLQRSPPSLPPSFRPNVQLVAHLQLPVTSCSYLGF